MINVMGVRGVMRSNDAKHVASKTNDVVVILSGAKDLWISIEIREDEEPRCLKARPHASHFVAALR